MFSFIFSPLSLSLALFLETVPQDAGHAQGRHRPGGAADDLRRQAVAGGGQRKVPQASAVPAGPIPEAGRDVHRPVDSGAEREECQRGPPE